MATFTKFQQFTEDVVGGVHDLIGTGGTTADTLKVYLTNAAPDVAADAVKTDLAEISAGSGYTAGGPSVTNVGAESTGTVTVSGTSLEITASGGSIGPFRYVVLYNDTPTSPADPLIGYWDYGSALTLETGERIAVKFNNADVASSGTIFTLA